eukprot:825883-Pyramimonas_sp.AAC.1
MSMPFFVISASVDNPRVSVSVPTCACPPKPSNATQRGELMRASTGCVLSTELKVINAYGANIGSGQGV